MTMPSASLVTGKKNLTNRTMNLTKAGDYDHLNDEGEFTMGLSVPEVAQKICNLNYGSHRFLTALVSELRNKAKICHGDESPLADYIEEGLNKGLYY